jgi:hypothetical protein
MSKWRIVIVCVISISRQDLKYIRVHSKRNPNTNIRVNPKQSPQPQATSLYNTNSIESNRRWRVTITASDRRGQIPAEQVRSGVVFRES